MGALQFFAFVCFVVAAILAAIGTRGARYDRYGDWWAVLVSVGLAFWLLSETKVIG